MEALHHDRSERSLKVTKTAGRLLTTAPEQARDPADFRCDQCGTWVSPRGAVTSVECTHCFAVHFVEAQIVQHTPPATPAPAPVQVAMCLHHEDRPPITRCTRCRADLCDECAPEKVAGTLSYRSCSCGGRCEDPEDRADPLELEPVESLTIPFLGQGAPILLAATVFYGVLGSFHFLAPLRFAIYMITAGYFLVYLSEIVSMAASGKRELPDWPDFHDWWSSMVAPVLKLMLAFGIPLSPALLYSAINGYDSIAALLTLPGLLYVPMGIAAVIFHNDSRAFGPQQVIRAIVACGARYAFTCSLFFVACLTMIYASTVFTAPWISPFLVAFLRLYVSIAAMVELGRAYHVAQQRLQPAEDRFPDALPFPRVADERPASRVS